MDRVFSAKLIHLGFVLLVTRVRRKQRVMFANTVFRMSYTAMPKGKSWSQLGPTENSTSPIEESE